jgi:hypothetical protein
MRSGGCDDADIDIGIVSHFYIPDEYFAGKCWFYDWALIELEDPIDV